MSNVTTAILVMSIRDAKTGALARVNELYKGTGFVSCEHRDLKHWYGGSKFLTCCIAIGAFNYLEEESLRKKIRSTEWKDKENVQLLCLGEEDDVFRTWSLYDDNLSSAKNAVRQAFTTAEGHLTEDEIVRLWRETSVQATHEH